MLTEQTPVLLVFPDLDNALRIRETLNATSRYSYTFYRAEKADAAICRIKSEVYAVIIFELDIPNCNGIEFIEKIRDAAPRSAIIVIVDNWNSESASAVIRAGAQDVILRSTITAESLDRSVRFAVERAVQLGAVSQYRSQQIEMNDQFLSQFSHELRSPITAVYQFVTILLDGLAGELKPEQREYLEITLRNVNMMREMVRDLMDVTRAQTGKLTIRPGCISVVGMIEETIISLQTTATTRGVTLTPPLLDYVPPVFADPSRVRQILNNLCDNALKFCNDGDTISVSAAVYDEDHDYLCISVSDTGCGISKEGRQQVFEYLYQDQTSINHSRKGLGIGLAICRELVSQHGGKIWVESEPGTGSIFSFILPRFQLGGLIGPVLEYKPQQETYIQLVTIALTVDSGATTLSESIRQRVWEGIEQGLTGGGEVLLPRISAGPHHERFYVVINESEIVSKSDLYSKILRDSGVDESAIQIGVFSECIEKLPIVVDPIDWEHNSDLFKKIENAIENGKSSHNREVHHAAKNNGC